ncbi:methyl-accepting chemotaxis protein [Pararhodospirillum oryzae]|nr:methyl-accepting chemotaxis protein [Pararhodospirillum oryzae]
MNQFSVVTRITIGFGALLVLMLAISILSYGAGSVIREKVNIYAQEAVRTLDVTNLATEVAELRRNAYIFFDKEEPQYAETANTIMADLQKQLQTLLSTVSASHQQDIRKLLELVRGYDQGLKRVVALSEARKAAIGSLLSVGPEARTALLALIEQSMAENNHRTAALAGLAVESLMSSRLAAANFSNHPSSELAEKVKEGMNQVIERCEDLKQSMIDGPDRSRIDDVQQKVRSYIVGFDALTKAMLESQSLVMGEMAGIGEKFGSVAGDFQNSQLIFMDNTRHGMENDLNHAVNESMALSVAAIALAILAAILISRSLSRPIAHLTGVLDSLRQGDTDVEIKGRDHGGELGRMARGLDALRQSVADAFRLNQMIEGSPSAVIVCGTDLRISYLNESARVIVRRMNHPIAQDPDLIIGRKASEIHHKPEFVHSVLTHPENMPYRGKFTMGGVTIENDVRAILDPRGRVTGIMLAWKDVTEYVRLSETFEASIKSVVEVVGQATSELETTSQAMADNADRSGEQASVVAQAAEQAAGNVETVASATEELSASITEISRQVQESARIASEAVAEAQRTDEMVQGLANAAHRIGEVVGLITDIASQTNLLALNATIEAARAGEMGKGFAVVAGEVKTLANQTAKATEEISSQITGIQSETRRAVEAIQAIGGTIARLNQIASAIAAAVEEQGAATKEIARNVEEASHGTTEVTNSIQEVNQGAQANRHAAQQLEEATSQLAQQASFLARQVQEFLDKMRA